MPQTTSTGLRNDQGSPLLVCFSHLRWDFVWQRPQHLLSRAAKTYRVLFIEEPIFQPGIAPHMVVEERPGGITMARPMLPEGTPHEGWVQHSRALVNDFLAQYGDAPRVFWYYSPIFWAFSAEMPNDCIVYDNMDELAAFLGAPPILLEMENELFKKVDVVFTGGMSLYEAKRSRHHNVHGLPSSIDAAHFARARNGGDADPADQAAIAHPRLGFFGVIDERMDVALVGEVAALRPDWQFVMIGPVVKIDPAILPQGPNIHWIGGKTYAELPAYLAGWDVGFMPFAINEATRYISPTKTPEFLAAGLPVVSTAIHDVVRPYGEEGLVEIATTAAEVVEKTEALLARTPDETATWLAAVDRRLAAGSWDETWAKMDALIQSAFRRRERGSDDTAVPPTSAAGSTSIV